MTIFIKSIVGRFLYQFTKTNNTKILGYELYGLR